MRIAIANFSAPIAKTLDYRRHWHNWGKPQQTSRVSLLEQPHDWGFHIFAMGSYLLDLGIAREAEFWDYREDHWSGYHPGGVFRVSFFNQDDLECYLERFGYPDLFINYGDVGNPVLRRLVGKSFRVHVPCLRREGCPNSNFDAECYLVDSDEYLDARAMLYVPVVNTKKIRPAECRKERDFIYLASGYSQKRHDLLLDAIRGTDLTGHLHPIEASALDLTETKVTTSNWYERDVVELLQTSRIAVYPGDRTSNPAAMWECVAAGLPIVVNQNIAGGKHLVVPGVTGELASEREFCDVMKLVLKHCESYRPRQYFETHWDTIEILNSYINFFQKMGLEI